MRKKTIALFVVISTLLNGFFVTNANEPLPVGASTNISVAEKINTCPEPSCGAAYLCHFESGQELYSKNGDTPLPMASTTKLMTALIVAELLPFDRVVTVDSRSVGIEGSSIYLFDGERITVETLMYGLLLESANDAATALAYECAGSIEGFCALMNRKARELGLENTHFTNPHGLDDEEHYTTARELSVIAAKVLENPRLSRIVATKTYKAPLTQGDTYRYMTNHNRLLSTYEGAIGMKTGFTKRTGRCLVSAAKRDGMTLICVTLDAADDWNAHRNMLDFGFDNYKVIELVKEGDFELTLDCMGGADPTVGLTNTHRLSILTNKSDSGNKIFMEVRVNRPIFAPIDKGKALGDVLVLYDNAPIASIKLIAKTPVEKHKDNRSFTDKIKDFFKELIS